MFFQYKRVPGILLSCLLFIFFIKQVAIAQSQLLFGTNRSAIVQDLKRHKIITGILGTYANAPRLENGRVDVKRLLAELKDIHANTYMWGLLRDSNNLEDLKLFLPLAGKINLKVWVSILPPSEPPPSEPFRLNYKLWATEFAALSLSEPNLVAWSIDDFSHNQKFFTPEYLEKILTAARAINPKLAFVPCCYYKEMTPEFVTNYRHLLNGILFPYRAESVGANLKDPTHVRDEIAKFRELFGPKFPIILDIYASAHSRLGATTPEYVKEVLATALKTADGVLIYRHQDPVKSPAKYQIIKKGFGKGFRRNSKMK